ncbi:MAG: phosphoribosylglycinamide synthetase C domain-containing protein, partial [Propionibacteriaceae bacterium]
GVITGLDLDAGSDSVVVHAGTARNAQGEVISAGGRVLAAVGTGTDLDEARKAAYARIATIHLDGSFYRSDIAAAAAQDAAGVTA